MNKIAKKYPKILNFVSELPNPEDTFLSDNLENTGYGFWPHLEYFLANSDRLPNYNSILKRLSETAPLSMEVNKAWGEWQIFRAAQSEVTTIFLIEKHFSGQVLQIVPESTIPTPDLKIRLGKKEFLVEIKAQSGQQHGDIHSRENGACFFNPKDEVDLKSWLFEEKISSRNGKPMKPKAIEAEEKGADILVVMTDFFSNLRDVKNQVSFLCPCSKFINKELAELEKGNGTTVYFFQTKFPVCRELNTMKEVWLYDESHLESITTLFDNHSILLHHLRVKR